VVAKHVGDPAGLRFGASEGSSVMLVIKLRDRLGR